MSSHVSDFVLCCVWLSLRWRWWWYTTTSNSVLSQQHTNNRKWEPATKHNKKREIKWSRHDNDTTRVCFKTMSLLVFCFLLFLLLKIHKTKANNKLSILFLLFCFWYPSAAHTRRTKQICIYYHVCVWWLRKLLRWNERRRMLPTTTTTKMMMSIFPRLASPRRFISFHLFFFFFSLIIIIE